MEYYTQSGALSTHLAAEVPPEAESAFLALVNRHMVLGKRADTVFLYAAHAFEYVLRQQRLAPFAETHIGLIATLCRDKDVQKAAECFCELLDMTERQRNALYFMNYLPVLGMPADLPAFFVQIGQKLPLSAFKAVCEKISAAIVSAKDDAALRSLAVFCYFTRPSYRELCDYLKAAEEADDAST